MYAWLKLNLFRKTREEILMLYSRQYSIIYYNTKMETFSKPNKSTERDPV
jgi:hypothetical protein